MLLHTFMQQINGYKNHKLQEGMKCFLYFDQMFEKIKIFFLMMYEIDAQYL